MNTHHTRSLLRGAVAAFALIGVAHQPAAAQKLIGHDHKTPVIAVGCLEREKDYRHEHSLRRSKGGVGNEYILVNAIIGTPSMEVTPVTEAEASCAGASGTGQAFELTGGGEGQLKPLVGRRVVINGMLKHTKHDTELVGTTGEFTPLPTDGGGNIFGGDLKLREINVDSSELAPIMAAVAPAPAPAEPAYAPEAPSAPPAPAAAAPEPVQEPTTVAKPELPKTASPVPAIGLIGLLSLFGAVAIRAFDRRRVRES